MNHYVPLRAHQRAALALASVVSTLAVMSSVLLMFDIEPGDPLAAGVGAPAMTAQAAVPACAPGDGPAADGCVAPHSQLP